MIVGATSFVQIIYPNAFFINLSDFNNFNDDTARLEAYVLIFMASYDSQIMRSMQIFLFLSNFKISLVMITLCLLS